jgi:antitoxin component YwqK of YwqJK toxin-antitoxin module
MKNNYCTIFRFQFCIGIFILSFNIEGFSQKKINEMNYPNSKNLKYRYEYIVDNEGSFIKDGFYKTWFYNGQINISGFYKSNKEEGLWKTWNENGKIVTLINYKNGMRHGTYKEFYDNGNLCYEINYINGIEEGISKCFYYTGELYTQIVKRNNKITGTMAGLSKNKDTLSLMYYDNNGKKIGKWHFWNEQKQLTQEYIFSNDTCINIIGKWVNMNERTTYDFDNKLNLTIETPMFENPSGGDPKFKENYIYKFGIEELQFIRNNNVRRTFKITKFIADSLIMFRKDIEDKDDTTFVKLKRQNN